MEDNAICDNCGSEIPEDEVQTCDICEADGLGNCCIDPSDHPCEDAEVEDD